jgi:hypothetical protein
VYVKLYSRMPAIMLIEAVTLCLGWSALRLLRGLANPAACAGDGGNFALNSSHGIQF